MTCVNEKFWALFGELNTAPASTCEGLPDSLSASCSHTWLPAHDVPEASMKNKLEKEVDRAWHGPRAPEIQDAGLTLTSTRYLSCSASRLTRLVIQLRGNSNLQPFFRTESGSKVKYSASRLHLAQKATTIIGTEYRYSENYSTDRQGDVSNLVYTLANLQSLAGLQEFAKTTGLSSSAF